MKIPIIVLVLGCLVQSCNKNKSETSIQSLLIEQLENTHTKQDWFVPTMTAIEGLSQEQVIWKGSSDNHSIIEIVSHLIFWNERVLKAFKEEDVSEFNNDNEVTFEIETESDWKNCVKKLDRIQTEWLQAVKNSTSDQINNWSSEISNMAAHNAYHTGQIIYIRKRNGWWK